METKGSGEWHQTDDPCSVPQAKAMFNIDLVNQAFTLVFGASPKELVSSISCTCQHF